MNHNEHVPEETIIDYTIGNTPSDQIEQIERHLSLCSQCQSLFQEWRRILLTESKQQPQKGLKEKIWHEHLEKQHSKKTKRKYSFMLTGAAAFFLLLIGLLFQQQEHSYNVAVNDEIEGPALQMSPQTERFAIIPVADYRHITGNLWLNAPKQELLLEVDGLMSLTNMDYQLWIIYDNDEIKSELLVPQNGATRMLIKGTDVNQFKVIKGSLEPVGGSQQPTGPEAFFVPIKN